MACISRGDFADFTAQLEGLTAVYQLNAEKKVSTPSIPVIGDVRRVCRVSTARAMLFPISFFSYFLVTF